MPDPFFNTLVTNPFDLIDVGLDTSPSFVDIDGDLNAFIDTGVGSTLFFHNDGTANEAVFVNESTNLGLADVGGFSKPSSADIDGYQDAFIGNGAGNPLFFRNNGSASTQILLGS